MTVDLFDYGREQYIPEVQEWVGAECFLPRTHKAGVNLLLVGLVMQMP
ncbi:MAG: DsrE/DsrF/DrsH-like family protein [Gammaproteobacteria bacterium]|nr:DsrE/DsrF/DrsH-like family protein [Gammaproteobacteria bacterium]